jgi:hypothetical protein
VRRAAFEQSPRNAFSGQNTRKRETRDTASDNNNRLFEVSRHSKFLIYTRAERLRDGSARRTARARCYIPRKAVTMCAFVADVPEWREVANH